MKRSFGKVLEQVRHHQLHEGHGVRAQVVRTGGVERGIAGLAHVHHRRHVELAELFVHRVPPLVGERRLGELAARGIGIEIAADEAEFLHAALELGDDAARIHARRLRQLADADEVLRIQLANAVDELVAVLGPVPARGLVADVMTHGAGARREDRHVGAARALQLELRVLETVADLVVADGDAALRRAPAPVSSAPRSAACARH